MNIIKFRLFAASLLAIIITLINMSTVAYYQTVAKTTNVVTSGNIQFIIHETTDYGKEFPEEGIYIYPGDVVTKEVKIESDCTHPFYLRVKMENGVNSEKLSAQDCFKLDISEEHWEFHDGWYYYKEIVQPGQITPNVFSQVEIVREIVDNRYIGRTLTLTVHAQAVQSENNPLTDDKIYTASGWPTE